MIRDHEFTNWSGSVHFTADRYARPKNHDGVVKAVRRAARRGRGVRPVGSGHSSTPLMVTPDVLMSLERMTGVVDHDSGAGLATVLPGTGLADLGSELAHAGLALENYGDVDYQAIAGALGTGTHGTGERFGNLSANLVGGTLVTGEGGTLAFGTEAGAERDDDLVQAAQVSLGALGILTSLTLRVLPAYDLRCLSWKVDIDWLLEHFDDLAARHRHVDFYWYPRSDIAQVRVLDLPERMEDLNLPGELHRDETGPSYQILPNDRHIRFDEMEYMLPREAGLETFRAVRERIKDRHRREVAWRVLVRTIAPDNAMLSNAHTRPTMTIALLHNAGLPYETYFRDMEPMLLEADGRPHWGKKHTRTAEHLRPMYPRWEDFRRIRQELDPDGVFLNDHLRDLLEET